MSFIKKPNARHPNLPKNKLGLTRRDYEGALSTLCAGCGHDSVSSAIIEACFQLSIPAHRLAKLSGMTNGFIIWPNSRCLWTPFQ